MPINIIPFDSLTKAKQIERWVQAQHVLESLPEHEREDHWDMGTFGEQTACGTIACAAGHCGMKPWFRRRGLQLNFSRYGRTLQYHPGNSYPHDVRKFFGIDGTEKIFFNGSARSVETVIGEIKAHIRTLKLGDTYAYG